MRISDGSSDVCSSDLEVDYLPNRPPLPKLDEFLEGLGPSRLVLMTADVGPTGVETSEHLAVALRSEGGARGLHLIREELDVRILLLQPRVVELTVDLLDRWIALLPCEDAVACHPDLRPLD